MEEVRPVKLRYTSHAIADIDQIHEYISRRSPRGATNVMARIRDTAELLAMWPGAGQSTNMENIRKQAIGRYPYVIFYTLNEDAALSALRQVPSILRAFKIDMTNSIRPGTANDHIHRSISPKMISKRQVSDPWV